MNGARKLAEVRVSNLDKSIAVSAGPPRPSSSRRRTRAPRPHPFGKRASSMRLASARRQRLGRRLADQAVDADSTSSAGPPLSRHVTTALAGRERLGGDEPVVLVERRKAHGAAPRQMLEQLCVGQRPGERHAIDTPSSRASAVRRACSSPSPPITARIPRPVGRRQRAHEEVGALERRQPRHHEDVVAVAVAAIRTLRRRRIEHRRLQLRPHPQPRLDRPRLDEQPRHVARQQIAIGGVHDAGAGRSP